MQYWLMKSEPETFSFTQFLKIGRTMWDGVRNYQARNFMKQMKVGELILFYHSNCIDKGVVGLAEVLKEAYPDPTATDAKSPNFDPQCLTKPERWLVVDLHKPVAFKKLVRLSQIKETKGLSQMRLVQKGSRLSVMPVTAQEFELIKAMGS